MNNEISIIKAGISDVSALAGIFYAHLAAHPEYISHGEVQMGIGKLTFDGEKYIPELLLESRDLWMTYLNDHINADGREVYKAVLPDGSIAGFCVLEDTDDGAEHFGVLCDILVSESFRGHGVGSALFKQAGDWFASRGLKDVYLESGKDNHHAHSFFEKRGFRKVSEVYKNV